MIGLLRNAEYFFVGGLLEMSLCFHHTDLCHGLVSAPTYGFPAHNICKCFWDMGNNWYVSVIIVLDDRLLVVVGQANFTYSLYSPATIEEFNETLNILLDWAGI